MFMANCTALVWTSLFLSRNQSSVIPSYLNHKIGSAFCSLGNPKYTAWSPAMLTTVLSKIAIKLGIFRYWQALNMSLNWSHVMQGDHPLVPSYCSIHCSKPHGTDCERTSLPNSDHQPSNFLIQPTGTLTSADPADPAHPMQPAHATQGAKPAPCTPRGTRRPRSLCTPRTQCAHGACTSNPPHSLFMV